MMEVRCCCDAGKLLGWLPDPIRGATKMSFVAGETILEFEVSVVAEAIYSGLYRTPAYKSRDYPMELLRKISAFVEAK